MSTPTHGDDVFTDVVNNLLQELHTIPHSTGTVHHLLINNLNSPILTEINHLSFFRVYDNRMNTLLPALAKMSNLTSLAFPQCSFSPKRLKFLFTECRSLAKLKSLDLSNASGIMSEDLHLLSQSTILINLTSLNFSHCHPTTSRTALGEGRDSSKDSSGLIALLSSPLLKNLTHLNLGDSRIDDPLVYSTISTSPFLSNLVSLGLSGNKINSDAIAALAASTTLTNLTDLKLARTYLGDQLISQLFSPPSLLATKLQSLDIGGTKTDVSSLQLLNQVTPHLIELVLDGNCRLGPAGAEFIAKHMPNLTKLSLKNCSISDKGYAALAASTALTNLRELNLHQNWTKTESIITLINSPVVANLTSLNLTSTQTGPDILTAIAQSPSMANLERLGFSSNGAGDDGVIALAQSSILTNLTWLDLGSNDIGPNGINTLCTSLMVSKLTHLSLNYNKDIGNSIAAALAAPSSTLYSLIELSLGGLMDDEGVLRLLSTPHLDQLIVLKVEANSIISNSTKAQYRARFDEYI